MSTATTDYAERWRRQLASHAIWIVLALLLVAAALMSDAFLRPAYLLNLVRQAAPIGITAVGVTLVMIIGGVDLSVGAVISLAAVLCAVLMDGQVENTAYALAITCLAGAAIGLANGVIVVAGRVSPFIVTLGSAIVVYGVMLLVSGGTARGVVAPGFREFFNQRIAGGVPVLALVFVGIAGIGVWLQQATRYGRCLYLIGANPTAADLSGLPVARLAISAYALSGLLAAIGGIALLARAGVSGTYTGRGYEFDVLAAVVLGGTTFEGGRGGIGGTVAGVFVLLIAFNLVNLVGLPFAAQLALKGLIIIAASAAYEALRQPG